MVFKCQGKGHKASNCPKNGKGGSKDTSSGGDKGQQDKRKCFSTCRKTGHIAKNCWEDEANASNTPVNWKSASQQQGGSEKAVAAIESGNQVEFLLYKMSFPTHAEILNDRMCGSRTHGGDSPFDT